MSHKIRLDAKNLEFTESLSRCEAIESELKELPDIETNTEKRKMLGKERSALIEKMKTLDSEIEDIKRSMDEDDKIAKWQTRAAESAPGQEPGKMMTRNPAGSVEVIDKRIYNGPFALGEQLRDVALSRGVGSGDEKKARSRLEKAKNRLVNKARAAGSPSYQISEYESGGIFLETETTTDLFSKGFNNNEILKRCDRRTMTGPKDKLDIISRSEQTRKDSATAPDQPRHGGIRFYWAHELDTVNPTQMSWEKITVEPRKMMSFYNASEEILQDVGMLTGEVNSVVGEEFSFKVQTDLIDGVAPGGILGIANSPALYTQPKKSGQAADTIVYENVRDMKAHQWRFGNSVWLINQFAEPQLEGLYIPTGGDGHTLPLYRPATDGGFATLYGRPVIPIEQCEELGDKGDIFNVDLSQYVVVTKGGMDLASDTSVYFLYDQRTFRFKTRIAGLPKWKKPFQAYKGTGQTSPLVTLAERA